MLDLTGLIWLLLVVFVLHDLEELITVENWLVKNKGRVMQAAPPRLRKMIGPSLAMSTAQFAVAVACMFAILSSAVLLTVTTLEQRTFLPFFLVCLHVLFLHVFTHVGQSLALRMYTPGVLTAVAVVLPYSLYTYFRLFAEGAVTWTLVIRTLPFVVLIVPILLGAHRLGQIVSKPAGR